MSTSRRRFLKLSALAGGSVGVGLIPVLSALGHSSGTIGNAPKPLNILILGGTGFTGPFQVKYALDRGHKVTVFNRGKTHPGELDQRAEQLIGDRNGQLDALKGRKWDVCIDIPTTLPVWVRDAAQILQGNVQRYVFISTISVFSDVSKPNMDENGPLAEYQGTDPMKETQQTLAASNYGLYGPLKALSEKEAEKWFPGKALIVRPGLIVGPGDESDRFTYWPVRIEKGGEVLAPGTPNDPVQFIDARDLAEWVIRMVEQGSAGIFNATGPNYKLTMGKMLNDIKAAEKSNANFTWADADFLKAQKVHAWSDMPTWVPPKGDEIGFSQINCQKAIGKGLTFRSIGDTTKATLEWFHKQKPERQAKLRAGLTAERETAVLAAWHAQQKPGD
ncbi:MAG TPA: NAD-dependent epimerase/dehydratase family protein [Pyrinomonadaceae bacterium]|jgi:2'-hydroxyisoflavone reductase|nr:NAD-dependent epimerase/dehydratase family protein [Pyrinomonadaceae bacterium]